MNPFEAGGGFSLTVLSYETEDLLGLRARTGLGGVVFVERGLEHGKGKRLRGLVFSEKNPAPVNLDDRVFHARTLQSFDGLGLVGALQVTQILDLLVRSHYRVVVVDPVPYKISDGLQIYGFFWGLSGHLSNVRPQITRKGWDCADERQ